MNSTSGEVINPVRNWTTGSKLKKSSFKMKLSTKRPLRCSVSPDPSGRPDTFTGDRRALRDSDPRAFRRLFRAVADARRHGEELDGGARIVRRVHEILLGTQISFGRLNRGVAQQQLDLL
jgi:hypothetical protein